MRAVTAAEMRTIDAAAVARDGEIALMRRAGAAIAALVPRYARPAGPIVGIAGGGNNGGDVFAALAALDADRPRVVYCDDGVTGSAARTDARARARAGGVTFRPLLVDPTVLGDAALILDGVLGANARLPLDPVSAALVVAMNAAGPPILAIDVPTGLDPSSGKLDEPHVTAAATIALGAPKLGCLLEPGRSAVGDLWCDDLGMDADAGAPDGAAHVLTAREFGALLPRRDDDSDKRLSGAPLVVAGSAQFPGAAVLCARGAARAGAGYVTVATPAGAAAAIRAQLVEQVVVTYDESNAEAAANAIGDLQNRCGSIAIGPGLGLEDAQGEIVRSVIARAELPIVADASALFHLGKHLALLRGKAVVVTPHAGEFARLSGRGTVAPEDRLARVRAFVAEYDVTTLLKGRSTIIADRHAVHVNPTGTPALATAGTGDVLTGMIGTLLAQGLTPLDAARVGAYWHGRAGRIAAERRPIGVLAGDLPDLLAEAAQPQSAPLGPQRIF
jgi:NAD(P)H-hydrate epimerase